MLPFYSFLLVKQRTFFSELSPPPRNSNVDKVLTEVLRENVAHHLIIIEAYQMLEDILSPIILVKYTQVTTLLCTLFVTILKVYKHNNDVVVVVVKD